MRVIYISGPLTASTRWETECHSHRAEAAAVEVMKLGAAVHCPHSARHFGDLLTHAEWLQRDLEIIRRCDAVVFLDNWKDSPGAREEWRFCEERAIPRFVFPNQLETFKLWLRGYGGRN